MTPILSSPIFEDGSDQFDDSFKKLDISTATLKKVRFQTCQFTKCIFNETVFIDCSFRNCHFANCEFNLAKIDGCQFIDCVFEGTKLVGLNWTDTNLFSQNPSRLSNTLIFRDCVLNHSSFMGCNLTEAELTDCLAREMDLSDANLTRSVCTGTDFSGTRFWHTNLTSADLRQAKNYTIAANLNTLKHTKFSLPEAMSLLHSLDIELSEN